MEELRNTCQIALDRCLDEGVRDWNGIKLAVKGALVIIYLRKLNAVL